ncbi:hypothetical protein GDO81_002737 [Engystomops pustulosus]|uniref:Importin N-terminal domain-containing protein n=1 Tax=Engystomops pustulosus TaxID=76066 RepID=A0AAV7DQH5_ENGPU|nr:hypothetical protein GDO81_002737 [Engystomops pustulosus]KAG8598778.1 hypothetical protein GDO81_002737 [Engystomops pustulosus]
MDLDSASSVVLQVLTQASSQDSTVLKPAEEQLKQWETQTGFYTVLLNIFTNHSLDVNVRWLAVLYFKNGIDRYWRRVAPNALSEAEKSTLRAGLITNFNEPVNQIATQISVLIAKVARLDCPKQWPELIPTLIESIKVQDELRQHRALSPFTRDQDLSSKRLAQTGSSSKMLASEIYSFACCLWNHHADTFLQLICTEGDTNAVSSLERASLSLKVLRKLTVHGFAEPLQNAEVMGFLNAVFDRSRQFLECSRGVRLDHPCRERLEKVIILFTKVVRPVEESGGDSWKYSLRPCSEVLFMDIFHEYSQTLTPVLLDMVHTLQGPTPLEDLNAILIKDTVYNAVGLAAFELFDSVDFDEWFRSQLLGELQITHDRYKLLRRRVIWLIGQWVAVKFKADLRPSLYQAILNLLQDQDLVVRIETATTLNLPVDDFEFRTEQFLPYLESIFSLLFQLLQQVTECDSKMQILHVLSCVIERVNMQIRPFVGCLVQYLPLLWKQSEEHNMLRCAILTTLTHLVKGLGGDGQNLYPFLLPVIQLSTDVSQPPHIYLLEDGLELW